MKTVLPPKIKNARAFIRTAPFTLACPVEELDKSFTESPARMTGEKGKTRIMWIECKAGSLEGDARIGRVSFSKSGRTLYYRGRKFQSLKGDGFKSNYFDVESGENYWISGPKKNGQDALYGGGGAQIDEDCRQEYWTTIRGIPEWAERTES